MSYLEAGVGVRRQALDADDLIQILVAQIQNVFRRQAERVARHRLVTETAGQATCGNDRWRANVSEHNEVLELAFQNEHNCLTNRAACNEQPLGPARAASYVLYVIVCSRENIYHCARTDVRLVVQLVVVLEHALQRGALGGGVLRGLRPALGAPALRGVRNSKCTQVSESMSLEVYRRKNEQNLPCAGWRTNLHMRYCAPSEHLSDTQAFAPSITETGVAPTSKRAPHLHRPLPPPLAPPRPSLYLKPPPPPPWPAPRAAVRQSRPRRRHPRCHCRSPRLAGKQKAKDQRVTNRQPAFLGAPVVTKVLVGAIRDTLRRSNATTGS